MIAVPANMMQEAHGEVGLIKGVNYFPAKATELQVLRRQNSREPIAVYGAERTSLGSRGTLIMCRPRAGAECFGFAIGIRRCAPSEIAVVAERLTRCGVVAVNGSAGKLGKVAARAFSWPSIPAIPNLMRANPVKARDLHTLLCAGATAPWSQQSLFLS